LNSNQKNVKGEGPRNLIAFSGGKDSLAVLIWATHNLKDFDIVFCDTGWEHEATYDHIDYVAKKLDKKIIKLKSQKYGNFYNMSLHKKRVASTKARFCTEKLKVIPMIDFVLTIKQDVVVYQGIRGEESAARSKMKTKDEYFVQYSDSNYKNLLHRKKDVRAHIDKFSVDVIRPIFNWSHMEVFEYIFKNGFKCNPLYKQGFSRVGCMPCVMSRLGEVRQMIKKYPTYFERLKRLEDQVGRTFFPPNYIPARFCSRTELRAKEITMPDNSKKEVMEHVKVPTAMDVKNYLHNENQKELFVPQACQSVYAICE